MQLLSEVKTRILKVLREYTTRGEVVESTNKRILDLTLSMNSLIDIHQRKIATTVKKIASSYIFTQYPPTNTISTTDSLFDVVPFLGDDITYSGGTEVKSYYFEADGSCTVYIEQSSDSSTWTILTTLTPSPTYGQMTAYYGLLSPTTDYYVRYRFSGTTYYNIRNIAFYSLTYPLASNIPPYKDYRPYDLPSDFFKLKSVVLNGQVQDSKKYVKSTDWEQEGSKIYLPFDEKGEYRIYYWKYPTAINDSTLDSTYLEIDDEAVDAIVYGVAMDLVAIDENFTPSYNRLQLKYSEIMSRLSNDVPIGRSNITQTLFSAYSGNKLF